MVRLNIAVDKLLELGVTKPTSVTYEKTLGAVALGKLGSGYVVVTVADDTVNVMTNIALFEYARGGSLIIVFRTHEVILLGRGRNYHSYIKLVPVDDGGYVFKARDGSRYALPNFETRGDGVRIYE